MIFMEPEIWLIRAKYSFNAAICLAEEFGTTAKIVSSKNFLTLKILHTSEMFLQMKIDSAV